MGWFVFEVGKVIQAGDPVALLAKVALMTSFAGRLEQVLVRALSLIDELLYE